MPVSPRAQNTKHKSSLQSSDSTPGDLKEVTFTAALFLTVEEPQSPSCKVRGARREGPAADPAGGDGFTPGLVHWLVIWGGRQGGYWERTGGGFGVTDMLCSDAGVVETWLFSDKIPGTALLKCVSLIACELYLTKVNFKEKY